MDFALVEVVDIDVVVVIRLVAMEIIPEERLTQRKLRAKPKINRAPQARSERRFRGERLWKVYTLCEGVTWVTCLELTLCKSITYRQRLVLARRV